MAILPPDPVYVMRGDMGPIHSLLFQISPYIEHLYAGAESGTVHVWDLRKNRELFKMDECKEPCLSMHMIKEEYFITQRKGGSFNLWQAHNAKWILDQTIKTNYYGFCRSRMGAEKSIFIPINDSKVGLFSLKTLKNEIELIPPCNSNSKLLGEVMVIIPCIDESKYVLVTYDGGQMNLWDVRSKKILSSLEVEQSPMAVDFNASLMRGIIGSPVSNLDIFSLSSDNKLSQQTKLSLKNPGISVVSIRSDAKVFATGGWDSRIRIYSYKTLRPLAVLDHHRATIHDIIYSTSRVEAYNNKCIMAATGKDGNISLWDLYN